MAQFKTIVYRQMLRHPYVGLLCLFICLYALIQILLRLHNLGQPRFQEGLPDTPTHDVAYIANNLDVHIEPPDNFNPNKDGYMILKIGLTNKGNTDIVNGKWAIFFNSFPRIIPGTLDCGLNVFHVNGNLYFVAPLDRDSGFPGIKPQTTLQCEFHLGHTAIARTDFLPNWYVSSMDDRGVTQVIASTEGDSLSFIGEFKSPNQWKSHPADRFNPLTPEQRFQRNHISNTTASRLVIPTPLSIKKLGQGSVMFDPRIWTVVPSDDFPKEVSYLADRLRIPPSTTKTEPLSNYIVFKHSNKIIDQEGYYLRVNSQPKSVEIVASSGAGAFYGVQTLSSLLAVDGTSIPLVEIRDVPRFQYRGVMIDVARNFQTKDSILKFIDAMSLYKLNKLHLHLSDDEGWRLEIPDLPELTEIGAKRCHPHRQTDCLIPVLGSGPHSTIPGSGQYTITDYREILKFARDRHVTVIPEIDMPGHAQAAIQSMEKRVNDRGDNSYILSENDQTAQSIQQWSGNAINPCLNSTYRFIEKIIDTLVSLHGGIQELEIFHFGGDEVVAGAWDNSPSCQKLFKRDVPVNSDALKKMFVHYVADIARRKNISIAAWEDGMYSEGEGPYMRNNFKNKDMYVIPWSNVWEAGTGGRAVEFADAGYKVILAMATHLYFDHPQEHDPEERGLHWATRYTDAKKTFGFIPDNIFANADVSMYGIPYNLSELCYNEPCPRTKRPENVIGLQGCLWGETIRSAAHLQYMAFPRVIALAERAWHKASWEDIQDPDERQYARDADWKRFDKTLGERELPRLDKLGIRYRVPPPGAIIKGNSIKVNTLYPNHDVEYSTDGETWNSLINNEQLSQKIPSQKNISLRAVSRYLRRPSRAIHIIRKGNFETNTYSLTFVSLFGIVCACLIYIFVIK